MKALTPVGSTGTGGDARGLRQNQGIFYGWQALWQASHSVQETNQADLL